MPASSSSPAHSLSRCTKEEVLITGHSAVRMSFSRFNMRYRAIQKRLEKLYRQLLEKQSENGDAEMLDDDGMDVRAMLDEFHEFYESELEHLNDIFCKTQNLELLCQQARPNIIHAYRLIAEFLLRRGHYEAGRMLVDQLRLCDEFNLETFREMVDIRDSLLNGDPRPFLEWAARNSPKLKQFKNQLENTVRLLFIRDKLLRTAPISKEGLEKCLCYAKEFVNVQPNDFASADTLGSVMLLFSIPPESLHLYRQSSKTRNLDWEEMAKKFTVYFFHANLMGQKDPFEAILEAGLLVTKSPACYAPDETNERCPTCHPLLRKLSSVLPYPHRSVSEIICRYTKEIIDEQNPGMMLPNGQVFGESAIRKLARDDGTIRCPVTGQVFAVRDAKRIFIV